jgi:hypothetical protein
MLLPLGLPEWLQTIAGATAQMEKLVLTINLIFCSFEPLLTDQLWQTEEMVKIVDRIESIQ